MHFAAQSEAQVMKCNTCWRNLDGRAVVTTCGHVFCIDDATRILSSDSACPLCERVLSKSDMKAVELSPKDEWVNMAMAGVPPDSIMKSALKGVIFWIGQMDVEAQLTISKAVQLREKFEEMQTRYMEKLQQVHIAYEKAIKKIRALEEEKESILKDKNELQGKYAEKSRQKRKLEEMYEALRGEYEKAKRIAHSSTAAFPVTSNRPAAFHESIPYEFTAPTPSGFDEPKLQLRSDSESTGFDRHLAPITPAAHSAPLWPARQKPGSGLFDLPGRPTTRLGRSVIVGKRSPKTDGGSSPFDNALFSVNGNEASDGIRNVLLSPLKRPGPTSRLPPSQFSS